MCAGYAACNSLTGCDLNTGQPQSVHAFHKLFLLFLIHQFIQSGHEHIACRSHIALYIKCSHILILLYTFHLIDHARQIPRSESVVYIDDAASGST